MTASFISPCWVRMRCRSPESRARFRAVSSTKRRDLIVLALAVTRSSWSSPRATVLTPLETEFASISGGKMCANSSRISRRMPCGSQCWRDGPNRPARKSRTRSVRHGRLLSPSTSGTKFTRFKITVGSGASVFRGQGGQALTDPGFRDQRAGVIAGRPLRSLARRRVLAAGQGSGGRLCRQSPTSENVAAQGGFRHDQPRR